MSFIPYNSGLLALVNGSKDFAADAAYAVLLTGAYTPDLAHDTYSDISGNECADTDYDPVALANKAVTAVGNDVLLNCDDINFGASVTISAQYLALVWGTAASPQAADALIGYVDFGSVISSLNSQFAAKVTNGVLKYVRP